MCDEFIQMFKWISVSDRLPDKVCSVLVTIDDGQRVYFSFRYFLKDLEKDPWCPKLDFNEKVTHWMLIERPVK